MRGMEWLLIAVIIVLLLMNVLLMLTLKKQQLNQEPAGVRESMVDFVSQLENENNELYDKLIGYIKENEKQLAKRIERLEKNDSGEQRVTEFSKVDSVEAERITQLYKQGFSLEQISKVLQTDQEKVVLIIKANPKLQSNFKEDEVL